ncbi:MAG: DNA replication and repair protein RecF [Candidatus Palauibacterales bacterium]|nr:DNA replication and repair protein RecF [Candidatus Palauibacterales bacterium]MDP2528496.1 DNA replication and repair protein RecF [Candidatus Palauibacterales bacterium]MDP2584035.1 DNA replication and repair protein RecF [Candidatus Palauibacterales bacterium]
MPHSASAHPSPQASGPEPATGAVRLGRIRLRDFRNFERLECELPAEGVMILGSNGAGKTNLLEAVYYLEVFRSFRGASDRELVRFGQEVFRVEATVEGPRGERTIAAAYSAAERRKQVEVDRREVSRLSDAIGGLGAVVFSLEDVEIVRGSPSGRRRFMDILLSLVEPGYVDALGKYRSVLSQRNEALKGGADRAQLEAWSAGLIEVGARVMEARARWVAGRAAAFDHYHSRIAGGARGVLGYRPSLGAPAGRAAAASDDEASAEGRPPSRAAWAEAFRAALERTRERERRRGVTVVGPHRDELAFTAQVGGEEERDLRTYGSGGQQRTAALALRLAEADTLRERLGREPVYLLDDVFAELDRERSGRLLQLLEEGRSGQVVLTSPKPSEVRLRGGLDVWRLRDGRLES